MDEDGWAELIRWITEHDKWKEEKLEELKKEWEEEGIKDKEISLLFDLWSFYDTLFIHSGDLINILIKLGKNSHSDYVEIIFELIRRKYGVRHVVKECPALLSTIDVDPASFLLDRVFEKVGEKPEFDTKLGKIDVVACFMKEGYGWLIFAFEVSVSSDLKNEIEKLEKLPWEVEKVVIIPKGVGAGRFGNVDIVPINLLDEYLWDKLEYNRCIEWKYYYEKIKKYTP